MIIKKEQKKNIIKDMFRLLISKILNKKVRICFFIFVCLGILVLGMSVGFLLTGFFGTLDEPSELAVQMFRSAGIKPIMHNLKLIYEGLVRENIRIPLNIISAWLAPIDKLYLNIDYESYQKIELKRDQALQIRHLKAGDEDFVPAKINFKEKTYDVKLRLKGDNPDHYDGDKWSFRIKLKGDETIFGMKVFSIQDPETRHNIHEFVFQEMLRKEGIIYLRTKLVNVIINGESKGIYQLQEHFDKLVIENNDRREAPIIRFNEDLLFERQLQLSDDEGDRTRVGAGVYYATDIDSFQTNKILADERLYGEYLKAKDLLESFRLEKLKTSEVFDVEKLATYFAISQLTGSTHGLHFSNMRFYYNPITSKLEPIGFDPNAGYIDPRPLHLEESLYTRFEESIFEDMVFFEKFIQELQRISDENYLNAFFRDFEESDVINHYRRENPLYHFPKSIYYKNQGYIRKFINPPTALKSYLHQEGGGYFVLEVANIQEFPVKLNKVLSADGTVFMSQETIILKPREQDQLEYIKIKFRIPPGHNINNGSLKSLKIKYSLLGKNELEEEIVHPWPRYDELFIQEDVIRQLPNVQDFSFINIDFQAKKIIFPEGALIISKDMIIPKGYAVLAEGGTSLNLIDGAKIISYSPFKFVGSEIKPVHIFSSDGSGGIVILNTKESSYLQYVLFENLRAPSENGWELTGAITFNEADVSLKDIQFLDIDSEDALNIVRSNFVMDNVTFFNASSDCFDGDFVKGSVKSSIFELCRNDGVDFSGSQIVIKNTQFNQVGDKALSFGEDSQAVLQGVVINQSYIGVASKDFSSVNIDSAKIFNSNYGMVAYQKKSQFGPASITVGKDINLLNVKINYLEEKSSSVFGVTEKESQKKVYELLYPLGS